jgi:hypothetical protein
VADRKAGLCRSAGTLRAEGGAVRARFLEDPIGYLGGDPRMRLRWRADGGVGVSSVNETARHRWPV